MRYLQLGITFSVLLLFISCKKEYFRVGHFLFVNKTSYAITYPTLFEEYNILPNSTVLIKQTQDGIRSLDVSDYFSPFLIRSKGPITIKFNGNKCLLYSSSNDIHSILDIKSFEAEKVDKFTYKFTYTFTESDYNRATACP
jgi:hypothetical protein